MKKLKDLVPFTVAFGVFILASNSPMQKQINQYDSVENDVKSISVEAFK
tara:strand:- start:140 stop:286 length:147 start_codon:yes stop_codon:yes gene_type:complete